MEGKLLIYKKIFEKYGIKLDEEQLIDAVHNVQQLADLLVKYEMKKKQRLFPHLKGRCPNKTKRKNKHYEQFNH